MLLLEITEAVPGEVCLLQGGKTLYHKARQISLFYITLHLKEENYNGKYKNTFAWNIHQS